MKNNTLKKHSAVIQMVNVNAEARKAYNYLLYVSKEQIRTGRNIEDNRFIIDIGSVKDVIGATNNQHLKDSIIELMKTVVQYNMLKKDKNEVWGAFQLLVDVEIERGMITYGLPKKIRETIEKPSMYAILDLKVIKGLDSKYSIALYELLEDYKKIGKKFIHLNEFKELMGIDQDSYQRFYDIKRRILDVAVNELKEKTPFNVTYKVEKIGRKVLGIELRFFYRDECELKPSSMWKSEEFQSFRVQLVEYREDQELMVYENKGVRIGKHPERDKYLLYYLEDEQKRWFRDDKALEVWKVLMQNKSQIIGSDLW